jgi:OmpA-OmpF porin, OOP family
VVDTLVAAHGIDRKRLTPAGAGMAAPIATNRTDEGRARNRRVEIVERVPAR